MRRIRLGTACAAMLMGAANAHAQALDFDVYSTRDAISASPATPLVGSASCRPVPTDRPLELQDAILQAICANPQARQAWANARAQAAAVGVGEAKYLPTLSATGGVERDSLVTTYAIGPISLSESQQTTAEYGMLNLNWVLFDFGGRSANLEEARQLLAAANAAQDDTLQQIFFDTAQTYYGVRDAQATVDAAQAADRSAKESLVEATALHQAGAGTLSDQLQAQTNYRRAVLDEVSAKGDLKTAIGTLAVAMGLDANTPLQIAGKEPPVDRTEFEHGLDQLIEEAKLQHPKLIAARARLDAARAHVGAVRAQGLPEIALTGSISRNNPSYQQQSEVSGSRGNTIGIQITIPLFDGFTTGYQVAAAKAQADEQEAQLQGAELQVSLDVWKSYQSLQANTANLDNSKYLLDDAQRSLEITRGRYKAGVGTIVELLNAQSALADARKQRVQALSKWRTDRLKLAESLGKLRDVSQE